MADEHEKYHAAGGADHHGGVEPSSLDVKPIVIFLVGLTISTILIGWLIVGLFDVLEAGKRNEEGPPSPLAGERQVIPPEPRLQLAPTKVEQLGGKASPSLQSDDPIKEMERYRAEEEEKLNNYGWIDEKAGSVRIPIEDAKQKLLKNGIPTRKK